MRKIRFFILCFIYLNFALYAQQSKPIIGYDRLPWGSTIQTVTQTYKELIEVTSKNASVGVREFFQNNPGGGITFRTFAFFQNKLYSVMVVYEDIDSNTSLAIIDKVVAVYGKFDDDEESSAIISTGYRKTILFTRYYNRNLTVKISVTDFFNKNNYYIDTGLAVNYIDLTVEAQINDALRKEKSDKIQL